MLNRQIFDHHLVRTGLTTLKKQQISTIQVNLGKKCNQQCQHCHVGAGPHSRETISQPVVDQICQLLEQNSNIELLDLTGGAPELNGGFEQLIRHATKLKRRVIDRCNLTVLMEPGMERMVDFLATHRVEINASLPCYTRENVDQQRGEGTFDPSIDALHRLNRMGYGQSGSDLVLNLVYNPGGAFLPGPQAALEQAYKAELKEKFDISFSRLLTITNMPINRFAEHLAQSGEQEHYMNTLIDAFNPATVPGLMCRNMISIGWDGRIYDCDFNQMLSLPINGDSHNVKSIFDINDCAKLSGCTIATGPHCFGCTAGAGSSCAGAIQ